MPPRRAASVHGEGLSREQRLRRSAEYLRCYRRGRRLRGSFLRLHFAPNPLGHARLGITASRKVGNAVARNRLKRRVREIFRRWPRRRELPALDVVVHLEPAAAAASFPALAGELADLLDRLLARGIPAPTEAPPR